MLMCFVLLLFALLLENAKKDWLSVNNGTGVKLCQKYFPSLINQMCSAEAEDPATSSASIDDLITRPCFFEAHEMGDPLKVKIHSVVDFLSLTSPAKSTSVNPAKL